MHAIRFPEEQPSSRTPGFYLRTRPRGFAAHITASAAHLRSVRELTARALLASGVGIDAAETAQLIVSELVGNAVRACGDHVPVVVEVDVPPFGVAVRVHDPDPRRLPRVSGVALDDPDAECGRGLPLLDMLAPGWHVLRSPIGKQIRCRLADPGRDT